MPQSVRLDAWKALGTSTDGAMTAEEALAAADLSGWNIRKVPAFTRDEAGREIPMAGRFATIRDNPILGTTEYLGDVGTTYRVIQNEEHTDFLNAVASEAGATFSTAGDLYGGRQVFVSMQLPGELSIGGDRIDMYIAGLNSHDGSLSYTLMVTPVRFECANMLNLGLKKASNFIRIRHTAGALKDPTQAQRALELTFDYLDEIKATADILSNTTLTDARFQEIILKEFGVSEDATPASMTRSENKIAEIEKLFSEAATNANIRNTAWAGLNALTEWYDHFSPTRGDNKDVSRNLNAVFYPEFKNRALELMLAEV